jgi:hypothetical protein
MSEACSARSIAAASGPFCAGCLEEAMVEAGDVCVLFGVVFGGPNGSGGALLAFIKKGDLAVKRARMVGSRLVAMGEAPRSYVQLGMQPQSKRAG